MPTCPDCGHALVQTGISVHGQVDKSARARAAAIVGAGGLAYSETGDTVKAPEGGGLQPANQPRGGGQGIPREGGRPALRITDVPGYVCNYCRKVFFQEQVSAQVDLFADLLMPEKGLSTLPYQAAVSKIAQVFQKGGSQ